MTESNDTQAIWEDAVPRLEEAHSEPNPDAAERAAMEDDIVRRARVMHDSIPAGYGSDGSTGTPVGLRATNSIPSGE